MRSTGPTTTHSSTSDLLRRRADEIAQACREALGEVIDDTKGQARNFTPKFGTWPMIFQRQTPARGSGMSIRFPKDSHVEVG